MGGGGGKGPVPAVALLVQPDIDECAESEWEEWEGLGWA